MTKKQGFNIDQREELVEFFAKSFHEVVVPILEDFQKEMRTGFDGLNKKIDDVEVRLGRRIDNVDQDLANRIEKVDRKIFNITDVHSDKLDQPRKTN